MNLLKYYRLLLRDHSYIFRFVNDLQWGHSKDISKSSNISLL